jgi:hypothetical protein
MSQGSRKRRLIVLLLALTLGLGVWLLWRDDTDHRSSSHQPSRSPQLAPTTAPRGSEPPSRLGRTSAARLTLLNHRLRALWSGQRVVACAHDLLSGHEGALVTIYGDGRLDGERLFPDWWSEVQGGEFFYVTSRERRSATAFIDGVGELRFGWPKGAVGGVVGCDEASMLASLVLASGVVLYADGQPGVGATVRSSCRSSVEAQVALVGLDGAFELPMLWPETGVPCEVWAQHTNWGAVAQGQALRVPKPNTSSVGGLSLIVPGLPAWAPQEGASFEESCAEQRALLEGVRDGTIYSSIPPEIDAVITPMRLHTMPPCATEGSEDTGL